MAKMDYRGISMACASDGKRCVIMQGPYFEEGYVSVFEFIICFKLYTQSQFLNLTL